MNMTWAKQLIAVMWMMCLGLAACQSVHSTELKTTEFNDINFKAKIYESEQISRITVRARTQASDVLIDFNEGEVLQAGINADQDSIEWRTMYEPNNFLFGDDEGTYVTTINRPTQGNAYLINYMDRDHNERIVEVPSLQLIEMIEPEYDTVINDSELRVTWNPDDAIDDDRFASLRVKLQWYNQDSKQQYKSYLVTENSGEYVIDLSELEDSHIEGKSVGVILHKEMDYYDLGVGLNFTATVANQDYSLIRINSISASHVNRSMQKSSDDEWVDELVSHDMQSEDLSDDDIADIVAANQMQCVEGEDTGIVVDGREYSFCMP